jgi:hypothetical protein
VRIEARVMTGYLTRKQKIFLHKHHKQARLTYSNFRIHMHAHGEQCSSYLESELLIKILCPYVIFSSAHTIFRKRTLLDEKSSAIPKTAGSNQVEFQNIHRNRHAYMLPVHGSSVLSR